MRPLVLVTRYNVPVGHINLLASDRDFDSNDYEALLALDENTPTTTLRAASDRDIEQLPVMSYRKKAVPAAGVVTSCAVCLEPFEEGEPLRVLPCFHQFHVLCVDKVRGSQVLEVWLSFYLVLTVRTLLLLLRFTPAVVVNQSGVPSL